MRGSSLDLTERNNFTGTEVSQSDRLPAQALQKLEAHAIVKGNLCIGVVLVPDPAGFPR